MRGFLSVLVLGFSMFTGGAQAALVVGNTYQDSNNLSWTYVGDYNVGAGPAWETDPANYSALQAAGIVFGAAAAGYEYAISTLDTIVNHLAWYDGYGDGSHLPLTNSYGGDVALAESFFSDVGARGYNTWGRLFRLCWLRQGRVGGWCL